MLDIYENVKDNFHLRVGAVIGIIIKNFQENIKWSDTRNATYDPIASDLSAIGGAGFIAFIEITERIFM